MLVIVPLPNATSRLVSLITLNHSLVAKPVSSIEKSSLPRGNRPPMPRPLTWFCEAGPSVSPSPYSRRSMVSKLSFGRKAKAGRTR